eukprot:CAMPEP_0185755966 /NCGR_PEP_ID=MMETSP1174-20130828/14431_1 /TAXON_ID=35687 /ORGANISM="Dictyocha speculum, Strain CCMP1381" /LENGTH=153 /DNA_ID=CAMNT_0028434735 /DNA_START=80 /DNA_END=541 /DNA_ORIENTATION=-
MNGEVEELVDLPQSDVVAVCSPPLAGGPWHGIIFFYWSSGSGLHTVSSANEGHRVTHVGASHSLRASETVGCLAFNPSGNLFVGGRNLLEIDPWSGMVKTRVATECVIRNLVWEEIDGMDRKRSSPQQTTPEAPGKTPRKINEPRSLADLYRR